LEGKLHLIEINRGADLKALHLVLGNFHCVNIFEEIFDICVEGKDSDFINFEETD